MKAALLPTHPLLRLSCLAALLGLASGGLSPLRAQVVVGYSSTTSASMSRVREDTLNLRNRSSFGIGGSNVEPIDGGSTYDERTIWRIRDTSQPSSLILVQENSVFDAREDNSDTKVQQAGRREGVNVTLLPPLSTVLEAQVVSPFAPVLPALPSLLSTTVFP